MTHNTNAPFCQPPRLSRLCWASYLTLLSGEMACGRLPGDFHVCLKYYIRHLGLKSSFISYVVSAYVEIGKCEETRVPFCSSHLLALSLKEKQQQLKSCWECSFHFRSIGRQVNCDFLIKGTDAI